MEREIPLYTADGVKDCEIQTYNVTTKDKLGLSLQRFKKDDCDDVVMIVHGLTTSTDMFIMPEHKNLVTYLHESGFSDVWSFDFRMSNRHSYNLFPTKYNMDDCALYDHPAAVEEIRKHIGPDKRLHVICHCLGSMSFVMSLAAKTVTGITSCISNSISLTPRVPTWSKFKITVLPTILEQILDITYVSPRWNEDARLTRGKILSKIVSLFHPECDVSACHMLSLMWGTGWPALYHHKNLHEVTHRRGGDLYGATGMNYHRHVAKMLNKANGDAIKMFPDDQQYETLPNNYMDVAHNIETPVLFMTGKDNKVFSDSNIVCYNKLNEKKPGFHQLHVFPEYGHQDVFMGKNNDKDIFPRLVTFLEEKRDEYISS
ncbi:MAG TPA: alpha/beta hydrolase [Gammaproteobacteria bacterium]|nr:alpha/beta hydrolase [Gammaproteobacteria bacterium]